MGRDLVHVIYCGGGGNLKIVGGREVKTSRAVSARVYLWSSHRHSEATTKKVDSKKEEPYFCAICQNLWVPEDVGHLDLDNCGKQGKI